MARAHRGGINDVREEQADELALLGHARGLGVTVRRATTCFPRTSATGGSVSPVARHELSVRKKDRASGLSITGAHCAPVHGTCPHQDAVDGPIVIEGPRFVCLRLTPAAYRHGLALALPDAVMARPTGVGRALPTYEILIEGRDEWLAAARRLA